MISKKYMVSNILKAIVFLMFFTIPYLVIIRGNNLVIQVETILFCIVLLVTLVEFADGRTSLSINRGFSFRTFIFLWTLSLLTLVSLFYTDSVLFGQLQDLTYWILSLTPLIFIKEGRVNVRRFNALKTLINASIVGAVVVIFIKIGTDTLYYRSQGFINNANLAGALFVLAAIMSFGVYLNSKSKKALIAFFLNCLAIIATGSREALVSFLIGLIILGFFSLRKMSRKFKRWFAVILLLTTIGVISLQNIFGDMLIRYQSTILRVMTGNSYEINSAFSGRPVIWEGILSYLLENPFRPLGFNGLRTTDLAAYSHNMFLQAWIIGGILGLILFLVFLVDLFLIIRKNMIINPNAISAALMSVFIGYVITGLVSDHFLNFFSWNFIFFTLLKQITNENGVI